MPEAVRRSDGFDRRHVYQLGIGLSLRAEFAEGALERLYWHDELPGKPESQRHPVRLARSRR